MAYIRERPNRDGKKAWQVRYAAPDGSQRTKTFARKADADRFRAQAEVDVASGNWVDPAGGKKTIAEWVGEWRGRVVDLRPSSLARVDGVLATHIIPTWGHRRIGTIRQPEVATWVAELVVKRMAPATVHKVYQQLAKLMSSAVDAGMIPSTPCQNIKLPRIERGEMRFLTPDEIALLADTIDLRYRTLVVFAAYSGLRFGEMAALKVKRVDTMRAFVEVAETLTEVRGHVACGPPKTRAAVRRVPVPRGVAEALAVQVAGLAPEDFVFHGPEGGPLRTSWRRRFFEPAVGAAGLAPLRPHDLRHTAVSLWIASGAHPREIQTWAGHASAVTILNVYGHLQPQAEDKLRSALDELLEKSTLSAQPAPVRPLVR